MGKRKEPKEGAPAPDEVKAGSGQVAMRAPTGTAAIGLPLDGDEVLQVRVPKNGVVRVSREIATRLLQHGFTQVAEAD